MVNTIRPQKTFTSLSRTTCSHSKLNKDVSVFPRPPLALLVTDPWLTASNFSKPWRQGLTATLGNDGFSFSTTLTAEI